MSCTILMAENAFDFINTIEVSVGAFLLLEFDDWVLELFKELLLSDKLIKIVNKRINNP